MEYKILKRDKDWDTLRALHLSRPNSLRENLHIDRKKLALKLVDG